jgi:putative ABC transport system permease protein
MPMRWLRRLTWWLNRERMADELREEMETHRALREAEFRRDGAADPLSASRRTLGNGPLAHDDARDVWIWPWLDGIWRDARYTLRLLRRRPGFAATCIATIAIGTGALTSVLAVVQIVLLASPPYPNHARIVQIGQVTKSRVRDEVSPPDVLALKAHRGGALQDVTTAWSSSVSLTGGAVPERARMVYTDSRAFAMLGTPPAIGRLPSDADDAPSAEPVVILGHTIWTQQFAADRAIVDKQVRIDGKQYTVIGVMPQGFRYPAPYWSPADLWLLRGAGDPVWPDTREAIFLAFGLLAEGATLERAQQEVDAVAASLDARYPAAGQIGLQLVPYGHTVRADAQPRLMLILGAASLVLLIVCVNVVNLLLGRSVDRHRELAARAALGAGRGRLVRQLITETLLLFACGGAAGVLLAVWGSRAIVSIRSYSIPRMEEAVVSTSVAGMAMGVVLVAAVVVGLVIAAQATSRGRLGLDAAGARGASEGRRWRTIQRGLVAAEVALALVLLCGAGVLLDGARAQARVTAGFDADTLTHARLNLARDKFVTLESQRAVLERIVAALSAIPGVRHAAVVDVPPGVGGSNARAVQLDTDPPPATDRDLRQANVRIASAGYFETLGLAPRAGRFFTSRDSETTPVAIVNEAFVAAHFGGGPAVGRQIRVILRGGAATTTPLRTIVGVYPNVKEKTIYEPTPPTVFLPLDARDATRMAMLVRTDRPLGEMTQDMRRAIAGVNPEQAAYGFMTLGELMGSELSLNKLNLQLLGTLGAVALLLAVIGVYGVTAHAVRQRTREIAIRLAMGITPGAVKRLLLRECAMLIGAGFIGGGIAGVWGASVLRSLVHGINSTSPLTFAAAAGVLATAVLAGCYVPARRAAKTDPAMVLRGE